jgi:hypothetical protein
MGKGKVMNKPELGATGWLPYKGKQILKLDYTHLSDQELLDRIAANHAYVMTFVDQGINDILLLSDVTEATPSTEAVAMLRRIAKKAASYSTANAVIGVDGVKRHLLNLINLASPLTSRACRDEDEAKEWLLLMHYS